MFHPDLWDLLVRVDCGASPSQEERDRILNEAGQSNDSFELMLATLESCKGAATGQDDLECLTECYGEKRADELVAATRKLERRRRDFFQAKWDLGQLIQEQANEYERRARNAEL